MDEGLGGAGVVLIAMMLVTGQAVNSVPSRMWLLREVVTLTLVTEN